MERYINGKGTGASFLSCVMAWFISHAPMITDVAQATAACISVVAGLLGVILLWKKLRD